MTSTDATDTRTSVDGLRADAARALARSVVATTATEEWEHLRRAHGAFTVAARCARDAGGLDRREARDAVACSTTLVLCAYARVHHCGLRRGWWPDLEQRAAGALADIVDSTPASVQRSRAYHALAQALDTLDIDTTVVTSLLREDPDPAG